MARRPRKLEKIPELPRKAIERALRESNARSRAISAQFDAFFSALIVGYREEIAGHFITRFKEIDPKTKQPVWDMPTAKRNHSYSTLSESFKDMIDSADEEAGTMMDEDLTQELDEGFSYGLWSLHQQGVDVSEAENPGGFDERKAILIAAGIAGYSYLDRLRVAGSIAKGRFLTWLKATIAGGRSLEDTVQGYDQIMHSHKVRVSQLAANENHRSMLIGVQEASSQFRSQLLGSVWLVDERTACNICLPKNLTITAQIPIAHSHPGCRCIKVPIALDYRGNPVDYVGFLQSIGRR